MITSMQGNLLKQPQQRTKSTAIGLGVRNHQMRHTDIRTTMNVYGDVVTDEMSTASLKVAELVFHPNGAQAERESS